MRFMRHNLLSVLMLVFFSASLWAVPEPPELEGYVPGDALGFAYYQGFHRMRQTFKDTAALRILTDPEVVAFYESFWRFVGVLSRDQFAALGVDARSLRMAYECEVLFVVTRLSRPVPEPAPVAADVEGERPGFAVVIRPPRERIKEYRAIYERLRARDKRPDRGEVVIRGVRLVRLDDDSVVGWNGNDLVFGAPAAAVAAILSTAGGHSPSILKDATYLRDAAGMPEGRPYMLGWWNVAKTTEMLRPLLKADEDGIGLFWRVSGLEGVDRIRLSVSPDPPGIKTSLFVGIVGKPKGFLAMAPKSPLDEDKLLKHVPSGTRVFVAARWSPDEAFSAFMDVVRAHGHPDYAEERLKALDDALGVKLREKVLPLLGDEVLLQSVGRGLVLLPEFVLSISVTDEQKLAGVLDTWCLELEKGPFGQGFLPDRVQHKGRRIIALRSTKYPLPCSPSLALSRDRLLIGLTPQSVKKAINLQDAEGPSLTATPGWRQIRGHLHEHPSILIYFDAHEAFEVTYGMLLTHLAQCVHAVPDFPVGAVVLNLPSTHAVTPHLFPSTWALSRTKEGLLLEGYGPFGGVFGPEVELVGTGLAGIGAGAMLTGVNAVRMHVAENASRVRLQSIMTAMVAYADDHDGRYPEYLGELLKEGPYLEAEALVRPGSHRRIEVRPEVLAKMKKDELKAIDDLSDYALLPRHGTPDPPEPWVYEKEPGRSGRRAVGFTDGHIEQWSQSMWRYRMGGRPAPAPRERP